MEPVSEADRERYLEAAASGDLTGCLAVVRRLVLGGLTPLAVYTEVLIPVQERVGRMWADAEVTVAQEHLTSLTTLAVMDQLRPLLAPAVVPGPAVVLATADGDYHSIGARIVADFFVADGWDVTFLGASVPARDLVQFVGDSRVPLVGLAATLPEALAALQDAAAALKAMPAAPAVIAGGPAVAALSHAAATLGVDATPGDAVQAVQAGRRLVGGRSGPRRLEDYLDAVGRQVRALRLQQGWNQDRLAAVSGLDRTYISAVENGKQNLTLKALVALASALGVGPERLMAAGSENSG